MRNFFKMFIVRLCALVWLLTVMGLMWLTLDHLVDPEKRNIPVALTYAVCAVILTAAGMSAVDLVEDERCRPRRR